LRAKVVTAAAVASENNIFSIGSSIVARIVPACAALALGRLGRNQHRAHQPARSI
jgi:hypothetical protein